MICGDQNCGCAIASTTLDLSGSGTPTDPWVIEQIEFTNLTDIENDIAAILAVLAGLPADYVNVTGDLMTGGLVINVAAGRSLSLRQAGDQPYLDWTSTDGATRFGYIQTTVSGTMDIVAEDGRVIRFLAASAERMRIRTDGIVLVAKSSTNIALTGVEFIPTGGVLSTRAAVGTNFRSNKTSVADVNGAIHYSVESAGTTIGSITRATVSTTAFNTSSDEELKRNIVEIDDQLALYWMRIVQPMLFEYIIEPDVAHGGYIAQRVAAAWPQAVELGIVTPGWGDITKRTWDTEGNETTPEEVWRGWQIDLSKFVPYIHAGLQAVDVRVSILEDLVGTHAVKIEALETEVVDLRDDLTALQAVVVTLTGGQQ